jgi:hypothetical protein
MINKPIKDLFANDISRRIEEVIKVDQADEEILRSELAEYIVTDSIRLHFGEILERYWETPKKPHEGVGVWVAGFFGSGKSSFAKYLGLALEDRSIGGDRAAKILSQRTGDKKVQVLLNSISEQLPTEAVIFDVSTDRGIRTGNQSITEIMYRLFLKRLGYSGDLDLSELEITLEEEGRLEEFTIKYRQLYDKDWDTEKGKIAFAVQEASRTMHELEPETYTSPDSWRESAMKRADITPGGLAQRCTELMLRRRPEKSLLFVIDEVGQFVARDVQKMLDLQAVVQNLGRVGRGKMWLVVTSQEKLTELVGGLDDRRVELARLMDRFPLQVHLESSDISEVTSKRVLSKNAEAEKILRELFTKHRGRLTDNTRLSADIKLPELSTEAFVDLYPLLPYQIDLIIQIVSGLRTQGGVSKHVGGANRTIIKLAQQLLIHPEVNLAEEPAGTLARIDHVYDLVAGNITSEVRGKIEDIGRQVDHQLAKPVAKAICLLQYVRSVHRTPENIAASLHLAVEADSRLAEVKKALEALLKAHMIRLGDDGYRIPTPTEEDWERQRARLSPMPVDVNRLHAEAVKTLWSPQPSYSFLDVKLFRAGISLNDRPVVSGNVIFYVSLVKAGREYAERVEESRRRSQTEKNAVFWIAAIDETIDNKTVDLFRSERILFLRERNAQTKSETALVAEERILMGRHQNSLRGLVKQALLSGNIFFRGNDRSPGDEAFDVGKTAVNVLKQVLPEVFDRFKEAAARVTNKDLESLMTTENLRGLTPVFVDLNLVHDQAGKPVFSTDTGTLGEVLARINNRTSYGEVANGRYLTDDFSKEPYGWDFDVVRLLVASLLRAGKIEVTSKGQVIESALSIEARKTLSDNNLFRQASFLPKVGLEYPHILDACEHFKEVFGRDISEIEQGVVANALKKEIQSHDQGLQEVHALLVLHHLPGTEVLSGALDQMRAILTGRDEQVIQTFNSAYNEIKEAIKRCAELEQILTEPHLQDLKRARKAMEAVWPFLVEEPDLGDEFREHAEMLADLMARETFFRELPAIDLHTGALDQEYLRRHQKAVNLRTQVYSAAVAKLQSTPGWEQLSDDQRQHISSRLVDRANADGVDSLAIPLIREQIGACDSFLNKSIEDLFRLLDGNRVVCVSASSYFSGGIETEEQLDSALNGLREECLEFIAEGKKVLLQ